MSLHHNLHTPQIQKIQSNLKTEIPTHLTSLFSSPVIIVIAIYTSIACILWKNKPSIMFNKDGTIKQFGTGEGKTLFSYPVILVITAIVLYFIVKYLHIFFQNKNNKIRKHTNTPHHSGPNSVNNSQHFYNQKNPLQFKQQGGCHCSPCFYNNSFMQSNHCSSHGPMVF